MTQVELKELTLRDGKSVFCRQWRGETAQAVVIYLHGLESHSGWFTEIAERLCRRGFSVWGMDRRGSGMNWEDRGHMESCSVLLGDIREVVEQAKREYPESKIFLMGICWGGKAAVAFAADNNESLDGLILVAPAIKCKADLSLKEKLDVLYSRFFRPRKLFKVPLDEALFTKNPHYIEFMEQDELKLRNATAQFFFESRKMDFRTAAGRITLPVLALLAGEDLILDNTGFKKWFEKVSSSDKTLKICERCCHCLPFEEPETCAHLMADWIEARNEK